MSVRIITDSGSDLSPAEAQRDGIEIVPVWIQMDGARLRDGIDTDRDAVLAHLQSGKNVETEPPSEAEFEAVFRRAVDAGDELVVVTLSSQLSQSYARASAAAARFGGVVHVVDSRGAAGSQTLLALYARELARGGAPGTQIASRISPGAIKTASFFAVPDVTPLGRSGRLPKAVIALGSMLNVSLVLKMNEQGAVGPAGQSFSFEKTCDLMVESLVRSIEHAPAARVAFCHLRAAETVQRLSRLLAEKMGTSPSAAIVHEAPPTITAHIGPGAIGVFAIVP